MNDDARIALLGSAQADIRRAIGKIETAVTATPAQDRGEVYTLLWLRKVVDDSNPDHDIGNIDDLIGYFLAEP